MTLGLSIISSSDENDTVIVSPCLARVVSVLSELILTFERVGAAVSIVNADIVRYVDSLPAASTTRALHVVYVPSARAHHIPSLSKEIVLSTPALTQLRI